LNSYLNGPSYRLMAAALAPTPEDEVLDVGDGNRLGNAVSRWTGGSDELRLVGVQSNPDRPSPSGLVWFARCGASAECTAIPRTLATSAWPRPRWRWSTGTSHPGSWRRGRPDLPRSSVGCSRRDV